ncbi:cytochrome-c oxidase, cbb3-type subunit III [uncultured Devosia sp.]|uniref:cytochrome-c oxidase, cbb3-type subunit III n=1 Tax=uncultured Devosia sp. TaxID=211434 RepID=UPI00262AAEAB|nr:cytochrome-c oxidase, cbb3-type subunit III [uncultured Devosia sp.]
MTDKPTTREIDELTGTETTGHEWDGIKELNTPMPRWWLWTFYATIAFSVGYTILFPAWPMISSATGGVLGYSSRAELHQDLSNLQTANQAVVNRITELPLHEILADGELTRFASAAGASAFKVNCSQCHGTGAAGASGYPNLNDDSWIWGGTVDDIYLTIAHGVRSATDPDTRFNLMPNFGADGMLDRAQIKDMVAYVAGLSGIEAESASPEAAQLFLDNCSGCHGADAKGVAELGGPDLTDAIWLYEGSVASIEAQLNRARHGMMPAWSEKLDDVTIKQLAIYVHGLGGGQ